MDPQRLGGPNVNTTTQVSGSIEVDDHVGSVQVPHFVETCAHEDDHPLAQPTPRDSHVVIMLRPHIVLILEMAFIYTPKTSNELYIDEQFDKHTFLFIVECYKLHTSI
jgi:hypothetical protein